MKTTFATAIVVAAMTLLGCGDDDEAGDESGAGETTVAVSAEDQEAAVDDLQAARREFLDSDQQVEASVDVVPDGRFAQQQAVEEPQSEGLATFTDETGALSVVAPRASQTGQLEFEGGAGMVLANGNPSEYHSQEFDLTISGVTFVASAQLADEVGITDDPGDSFLALTNWVVEEVGFFDGACDQYGGVSIFERDEYSGLSRTWTGCGGTGRIIRDAAVIPEDGSFIAYVQATFLPSEKEIADTVFDTFDVDGGALPGGGGFELYDHGSQVLE